jgi:copper chaperone CopZ
MRSIVALTLLLVDQGAAYAADVQRTLALTGLTCPACSAAVTKALKHVDGVRDVTVNDERTQAVVVVDESVSPSALVAAVERAGYEATVAPGPEPRKSREEGETRRESIPGDPSSRAAFEDVEGIEALRDRFNRDGGAARLILLLSPT